MGGVELGGGAFAAIMLGALLIDAALGWPAAVFARIGHPVTWIGRGIAAFERRWNHGSRAARLWRGAGVTAAVVALAGGVGLAAQLLLPAGVAGVVLGAVLAWPLIAVRSLHDHVTAVARPLEVGNLAGARGAVAMIVGRDPSLLDDAGVARAATESLAENTCDGIIAPLFWGSVAGLPGIAAYKAINTLDSMIGHRSDRFEAFGKVAARLDDVVNRVPARLTGALFALAAGTQAGVALRVMRCDAAAHRSPNAGWPEGAMAGALGIRLSGPRAYGDHIADEPWLNGAAPDPAARDLIRALALYRRAIVLCALALAAVALIMWAP